MQARVNHTAATSAPDQGWPERLETAATFYSVHVGLAVMATCSVAQRRLAERAAFLRRSSKVVRGRKGGVALVVPIPVEGGAVWLVARRKLNVAQWQGLCEAEAERQRQM